MRDVSSLALEQDDDERLPPVDRLWLAVLCQLLNDASAHRAGGLPRSGTRQNGEAALAQVAECGPELRFVCMMAGFDPVWIREKFLASSWLGRRGKARGFPRRGEACQPHY